MRLPLISFSVAGAALAFGTVGASPLKILVVSSSVQTFVLPAGQDGETPPFMPIRFGLAAANSGPMQPTFIHFEGGSTVPMGRKQRLCAQMRKMKDAVTQALGLDKEEMLHALPIAIEPVQPDQEKEHHHQGHRERLRHRCGKGSFLRRIHLALASLGTWEGRAVAFVLGCGLGVVLRMAYVFSILIVRAINTPDNDEDPEVLYIALPVDEVSSQEALPAYTDEKLALVADNKV